MIFSQLRKRLSSSGRPAGTPQGSREQVLSILRGVCERMGSQDIAASGIVQDIVVQEDRVIVTLGVSPDQAEAMEPLRAACERALADIGGFRSASVSLTHHRASGGASASPASSPRAAPPTAAAGPAESRSGKAPFRSVHLDGIGSIILVASGKGGVGKSTVAVNLALALVALEKRVGLLDGDIFGPSIARMMGLEGRPASSDGKTIIPKQKYGLRCMSIGLMMDADTPVIWRGPMVQSALMQLLGDVEWGDLDVLVVDMPPGTGDAQLTMAQQVRLAGAVVVSTPQEVALMDVRRSIRMFARVDVPVLGVVENMSHYVSPQSREKSYIFGKGGARRMAEEVQVPFLGEIPLMEQLCQGGDEGRPVLVDPDCPEARPFLEVARGLLERLQAAAG